MPILVGFAQSTAWCWDMYYIFKVNSSVYGYCIIFFPFIRWCIESSSFCTKKNVTQESTFKNSSVYFLLFSHQKDIYAMHVWHKGLAIRPCFFDKFHHF